MTARGRFHEGGYTLVELLVVLLLCSFIALAVGGGLSFGTRVWEGTEASVQVSNHTERSQSLLRELFASATPVSVGEYVDFEGDPSHVVFTAPAPRALAADGLERIEIAATKTDSGTLLRLLLRSRDGARTHELAMATGSASLRFAYLDASESIPVWLDRWHDRNRLPDAVRIRGDDDASRDAWPEFVAKLEIAQRPNCTFDSVALDCRRS